MSKEAANLSLKEKLAMFNKQIDDQKEAADRTRKKSGPRRKGSTRKGSTGKASRKISSPFLTQQNAKKKRKKSDDSIGGSKIPVKTPEREARTAVKSEKVIEKMKSVGGESLSMEKLQSVGGANLSATDLDSEEKTPKELSGTLKSSDGDVACEPAKESEAGKNVDANAVKGAAENEEEVEAADAAPVEKVEATKDKPKAKPIEKDTQKDKVEAAAELNIVSGAMQAQIQQNKDAKEEKVELEEVAKMDAVNEDSKAVMNDQLADKMAKQKMDNKAKADEANELAEVAAADPVNDDSKSVLKEKLSGKMQQQKMMNMDAKEEAAELKQVANMDPVSEESKAAMKDMLADKMAKQQMDNKAEADKRAELAEVAAADPVNDGSVNNLKEKLSGKIQQQKMMNMDAKEDAAELKEIAAMDAVNEDSKAVMAGILAAKNEKQKMEQKAPSRGDMESAKLLYVQLKMDYTKNPQIKSIDDLKKGLGAGGMTKPWATLNGLRHKYFIYNEKTEVCSGVYVFYDQASLDTYMDSDLFKAHATFPHVSKVTASVKDVMPGTEACIEKVAWKNSPPTQADVSQAKMLVVDITMNYEHGIKDPPLPTNWQQLYPMLAGGYTSKFANLKGLRGKYFAYDKDIDHCYGFYTFLDQTSLDEYMASDLFKSQGDAPHIGKLEYSVHDVLPGTERSIDLGEWPQRNLEAQTEVSEKSDEKEEEVEAKEEEVEAKEEEVVKANDAGVVPLKEDKSTEVKRGSSVANSGPTRSNMESAKILYVQLKMDYTKNPQITSIEDLKKGLGDGGMTTPWATLNGLRHKYFVYDNAAAVCSGVYVFYDQSSLDEYMNSDLFKAHETFPHVSKVTASVKDVIPGTEECIEKTPWENTPPTREDLSKAKMLIVDITMNYEHGVKDPPLPTSWEQLFGFLGSGYTAKFANLKGLRGKYFAYDKKIEHCYGFYTFIDQASLDEYMGSDLFKSQDAGPHIGKLEYTVHDVLPGSERSMDLGDWPREQIEKEEDKLKVDGKQQENQAIEESTSEPEKADTSEAPVSSNDSKPKSPKKETEKKATTPKSSKPKRLFSLGGKKETKKESKKSGGLASRLAMFNKKIEDQKEPIRPKPRKKLDKSKFEKKKNSESTIIKKEAKKEDAKVKEPEASDKPAKVETKAKTDNKEEKTSKTESEKDTEAGKSEKKAGDSERPEKKEKTEKSEKKEAKEEPKKKSKRRGKKIGNLLGKLGGIPMPGAKPPPRKKSREYTQTEGSGPNVAALRSKMVIPTGGFRLPMGGSPNKMRKKSQEMPAEKAAPNLDRAVIEKGKRKRRKKKKDLGLEDL